MLSLGFLREMVRWAGGLAALGTLVMLLTGRLAVAAGLAVGAAIDTGSLWGIVHYGERSLGGDVALAGGLAGLFMVGRLVLKGVVLGAAALFPLTLDPWGAAIGVLVVDATILTVGAVRAARWV
jgi:hypothetical protein